MYNQFLKYIHKEQLFDHTNKLLLGVSGGVDSVVLTALVTQLGCPFAIAHCNFQLRGEESDGDEQFVKQLAEKLGVKCFNTTFATRKIAADLGISIEMAARDLRYEWFEEIRANNNFDYIVVAHHLDDVLETFLLNLSRGTGIRGLTGIKPKVGKIVRPILFAQRAEIEAYAKENELVFRTDSSNADTSIKRNLVRHKIIPLLQETNPAFKQNFERSIRILHDTEQIYLQKIEQARHQIVTEKKSTITINKSELKALNPIAAYLYEFLRPFDFNADVVNDIIEALDGQSGTKFFSSTHRLVIDRESLIINLLDQTNKQFYVIEKDTEVIDLPFPIKFSVVNVANAILKPNPPNIAYFDYSMVLFPLIIRKWEIGEYFKPLGMSGFKKLSDFFIDEKMSIPEKEKTWLLANGNHIMWVMGKRIDDRCKLTGSTQLVLKVEIIDGAEAAV